MARLLSVVERHTTTFYFTPLGTYTGILYHNINLYCLGTCSYYGNSHIQTFDDKSYDMKGKCAYVLSKHCHAPNGQSKYEIRLVNKNRIACSSPGSKCEKEIEVRVDGEPVIVLRKDPLLTVDGQAIRTYYTTSDLQINFFGMTNVVVKSVKAHISILWTGDNLYIRVDSSMFKQTCGLCGTFDDDISNDFHTHDDDNEISEQSFAWQWTVQDSSSSKCVEEKWNDIKYCDFYYDRKPDAIKNCQILKDKLFENCHSFVSADKYYDHCLSDGCALRDDYIHVVHAYIKTCADEGVMINGWKPESSKRQLGEY